jgi:Rrf2 family iron-sulfur cluster assembly transcriptional regulator
MMVPRRGLFAIAAVLDIALHARPTPVAARALAQRHNLPPRHLETMLQALVRSGILKGTRGAKGGYELARERRRVTVADILRATAGVNDDIVVAATPAAPSLHGIVAPLLLSAAEHFLAELDRVSVEDLCRRALSDAPVEQDVLHDIGL